MPKSDKKRRLSERSEFRRFPISVLAACAVRAQRGPPSSGSPSFAYFAWRSKKSRSAAGPNPGYPVRQGRLPCFTRQPDSAMSHLRLPVAGRKGNGAFATDRWRVNRADPATVGSSRVFVPAADPLFCFAKKVGQKRRPRGRRPATRGTHVAGTEIGKRRNSLRSDSRRFLSDFGTSDVAPSTGSYCRVKSSGNGNCRYAEMIR